MSKFKCNYLCSLMIKMCQHYRKSVTLAFSLKVNVLWRTLAQLYSVLILRAQPCACWSKCVGNGRLHVSCYAECFVSNLVIPNAKKSSIILSAFQIQYNALYLFKFTSTVHYVYGFFMYTMYIQLIHILFSLLQIYTVQLSTSQPGLAIDVHVHAMLSHLDLFNKHSLKKPVLFLARVIYNYDKAISLIYS